MDLTKQKNDYSIGITISFQESILQIKQDLIFRENFALYLDCHYFCNVFLKINLSVFIFRLFLISLIRLLLSKILQFFRFFPSHFLSIQT